MAQRFIAAFGGRLKVAVRPHLAPVTEDPLWLATAVPRCAGMPYLEAGMGSAVAALAVLQLVPHSTVHGFESNPHAVIWAQQNAQLSGLQPRLHTHPYNIAHAPTPPLGVAHSFANPPFHPHQPKHPVKDAGRRLAHSQVEALAAWLKFLYRHTMPGGTLTLIVHSHQQAEAGTWASAMGLGCRSLFIKTHPRRVAKRAIVQMGVQVACGAWHIDGFNPAIRHGVLNQGQSPWNFARAGQA